MKTIERSFTPIRLWEKVELSNNYPTALKMIEESLYNQNKYIQHKNKQRLTKLT